MKEIHRRQITGAWRLAAVAVLVAGTGALGCGGGTPQGAAAWEHVGRTGEEGRPSIFLLTIDTLRADHLPFYGSERNTAPNLARLAEGAVVYDRAYSTSSWTVPSVVSWLTGVTPFSHGVFGGVTRKGKVYEQEVIPPSLRCLPEVLGELGYDTMGVTANAHLDAEHGFGRGFGRFSCLGFSPAPQVNRVVETWLHESRAAAHPRFLWTHYFDPHAPYIPRQPWFGRYAPDVTEQEMKMLRLAHRSWPKVPPEIKRHRERYMHLVKALYDSEIAYCDQTIGELLRQFPELDGFWVIVASDHGEEIGDHGYMGHGHTLYNETVRVPLFVRPPHGGAAGRITAPVSAVDITRTILAIAGWRGGGQWQGSVLPGLDLEGAGSRTDPPLAHLARFPDKKNLAAVIGARWKLIRDLKAGGEELYDLEHDFDEQHDLAGTRPRERERMSRRLSELVRQLPPPPEDELARAISRKREEQLRSLGYLR